MRPIDADALIDDCKKYLNTLNPSRDGKECTRIHWLIGILSNAPTIEPERKVGKWIVVTDNNGQHYVCDHCGQWRYHQGQKFCSECGYVMTEEGDQNG